MVEFASVIEVWLEAEDEEHAGEVMAQLQALVRAQPEVTDTEVQRPEEM